MLAELKVKEQRAREIAREAARKTEKAQRQRQQRAISRQIKAAVLTECQKWCSSMEVTLQKATDTMRAEIEETLRAEIEETLRAEAEQKVRVDTDLAVLKSSVAECEESLKEMVSTIELKSTLTKFKSNIDKRLKKIGQTIKNKKIAVDENAAPPPPSKSVVQSKPPDDDKVMMAPPPLTRTKSSVMAWDEGTMHPVCMRSVSTPNTLRMTTREPHQPLRVMEMSPTDPHWGWGNAVSMRQSTTSHLQRPPTPHHRLMLSDNNHRYTSPVFSQRNFANTTKFV